jgi:pimeloyl-ACP methyl ester carboxylesterase
MPSPSTKRNLAIVGSLAAAAAGALVYRRYRRDLRAAESRVSSGSKLAGTASGLIEYADAGTGAPVLVIHGAGGGFDQGLEFGQPLLDHGFRVIAPSRFGYLRTPLPAGASPMAQADAHARLLDALHLEKVAVVGVSAGSPSAMQLCLRHPQRCTALVLAVPLAYCAPATSDEGPRPEPQNNVAPTQEPSNNEAASPNTAQGLKEFVLDAMLSSDFAFWALSKLARNAMIRTILGTPPEDLEEAGAEEQARVVEFLSHIQPISRRKNGLQNEGIIARSLARYDLERLQVPTLVIGVENCGYNTYPAARYTAQNIPGARFLGWPTGGHLAVGHREELWSEVEKFLRAVAEGERRPA